MDFQAKSREKLVNDNYAWPAVQLSVEDCKRLWQPWYRALIVKVLDKSVGSRYLQQKIKDV